MRLRRLLARLFLSLMAVLVFFGVGEVVLRVAPRLGLGSEAGQWYNTTTRRSADPDVVWELDPEHPLINSDGLRDREYPFEKPPGAFRIVVVGDSITYGDSIPLEDTYVKRLERLLNARDGGRLYEVINLGVSGYNTGQELARYLAKGRSYSPDLLVIGVTMNDAASPDLLLRLLILNEERERLWYRRSKLVSWFADPLGQAPDTGVNRALFDDPEGWGIVADGFSRFADLAREDGTQVLVVIFPYLDDLDDYGYVDVHERVAREAARHGFGVLDLLPVYREHGAVALRRVRSDFWHPGPAGHAIAAESIRAALAGDAAAR